MGFSQLFDLVLEGQCACVSVRVCVCACVSVCVVSWKGHENMKENGTRKRYQKCYLLSDSNFMTFWKR